MSFFVLQLLDASRKNCTLPLNLCTNAQVVSIWSLRQNVPFKNNEIALAEQ